MAAHVSMILLPLLYLVIAESHILDPNRRFGLSDFKLPHFPKKPPGVHHHPSDSDVEIRGPRDKRPVNGDIFSYNAQHSYNHFYDDNNGYNPMFPFFGFNGPYGGGNFDHMPIPGFPFGVPSIQNNFMPRPGVNPSNKPVERPNSGEDSSSSEHNDDKHKKSEVPTSVEDQKSGEEAKPITDPKLDDIPPKTNVDKKEKPVDGDDKNGVNLDPSKDFLLVGTGGNGNNIYLLHENPASSPSGYIVQPNQPGSNVVYLPYNPQGGQVYPQVNSNIPLTHNKQDSNGVTSNPSQNNNPDSYVLIYANGQLIKIPGVVMNQQSGILGLNQLPNSVPSNSQNVPLVSNPGGNVVYANVPSQGNPVVVQVPSNGGSIQGNIPSGSIIVQNPPASGNVPGNTVSGGVVIQNPQPSNVPSNVVYGYQPNVQQPINGYIQPSNNQQPINAYVQPSSVQQPINGYVQPSNVQQPINGYVQPSVQQPLNGYVQPSNIQQPVNGYVQPSVPNQGYNNGYSPVQMIVQPTSPGNNVVSNQPINYNPAPMNVQPVVSNPDYQPTAQQKDENNAPVTAVTPIGNVITDSYQPITEAPIQPANNALASDAYLSSTLGARPAIMVSGFKETDDKKTDDSSEDKKEDDDNVKTNEPEKKDEDVEKEE
ncbi:uncharacterized protein LOC142981844 [Anticarsia gemmatalis]|uniref:uncharacterized protein LOC142981844 n=1 Tax=Anticarsia gemmatalis TaxID=129554 RepID=UPI003F771936